MNLMSLFIKIGADTDGAQKGIENIKSAMQSTEGKAEGFKTKLVNAFKTIAKVAAVKAVVENVYKLGKAAYDAYGEYEQLSGGVETLFKNSASTVKQYAEDAYKTAGLSANEYMSTVTSFSAAMIQSLGGDTKKAAELSNQAIIDMADNANKMGSSMESIQTAYQGFSKQNYTMLDNLKLGYGGTKSEMERLILDAEKMDKSFSVTHTKTKKGADEITYSYADIVQAIHIVQTNMDITGTTAKEASETIQGSIASTKAAFSNLVLAIGRGKGVKDAVKNVVSSAKNVAKNSIKAIKQIAKGFGDVAVAVGEMIVDGIKNAFNKLLENAAPLKKVVNSLLSNIFKSLSIDTSAIKNFFISLFDSPAIKAAVSKFSIAFSMVNEVIDDVKNRLEFVISTFKSLINTVVRVVKGELTFDSLKVSWDNFVQAVRAVNWGGIISTLVDGFKNAFNQIMSIDWAGLGATIWNWIKSGLSAVVEWFKTIFNGAANGIKSIDWAGLGETVWGAIKGAFSAVVGWFKSLFGGKNNVGVKGSILDGIDWAGLGTAIWDFIKSPFDAVVDFYKPLFEDAKEAIAGINWTQLGTNIWDAIKGAFSTIGTWFMERFEAVKLLVLKVNWVQLGTNIWDTIKSGFTAVGDWIKGLVLGDEYTPDSTWSDVGGKLWSSIKSGFTAKGDWIKGLVLGVGFMPDSAWSDVGGKLWSGIKSGFTVKGDWIKGLVLGVGFTPDVSWKDAGGKIWLKIADGLASAVDWLKGLFDGWTAKLTDGSVDFSSIGASMWTAISSAFSGVVTWFKNLFGGKNDEDADSVKGAIASIDWAGLGTSVLNFITAAFTGVGDIFKGFFVSAWDSINNLNWGGLGRNMWNAIKNAFSAVSQWFKDTFKGPINGVIDFLNSMISRVQDAVNTIVDGINTHLRITIPNVSWSWDFAHGNGGFKTDYRNPFMDWNPRISRVTLSRIKKLAEGGVVSNGGHAIVGEAGAEYLRVVNGQAVVTPIKGMNGGGDTYNTINIYQQPGQDPRELAEIVQRELVRIGRQQKAVYA